MSMSLPRAGRRAEPDSVARQDAHRLAALARDCGATGVRRRCLILRLSCLPADLTRPHHLRLAGEALDPMLLADRAQRFLLPNNDIAVVWRGTAEALLAASQNAVRAMLSDTDPAIPGPDRLWRVLDLPEDADTLRALAIASLSDPTAAAGASPGVPLDPAALAALEAALAHADVARFARRRAVCTREADGAFRLAWELRTLALDELCAELAPGRDARAEPWLYRRLARTLDRRLLALLAATGELRAAGPFGLELAVGSVLSAEFLRFDAALPHGLRGQVTLGLEPADMFADLPAFVFARDFARARGYRLLLRAAAGTLLPVLPAARLGMDLAELPWSEGTMALPTDLLDEAAERLVLVGADSAEAVAWGRANGIRLFEGRAAPPARAGTGRALALALR
jgi:hypothetical protein